MHFSRSVYAQLLLALASTTTAQDAHVAAAPLEDRAVNCAKITGALSVLKQVGPLATAFCSDYLHIPKASTVTVKSTPITTVTTSTSTTTISSTICPQSAKVKPRHARPFGQARNADAQPAPTLQARIDLPGLASYAQAEISSGCSCLNIAPKTATTTTQVAPTSTVKVVATATSCVTICQANTDGAENCGGQYNCCTPGEVCCNAHIGAGNQQYCYTPDTCSFFGGTIIP